MKSQLSWDEYFMNIADEVAKRSKDPSSQNGCVIVDAKHRPVSFGYNGTIQGANEDKLTLSERPMKYYFAIHSEMNALIFAHRDLTDCTLYNRIATCENCLNIVCRQGLSGLYIVSWEYIHIAKVLKTRWLILILMKQLLECWRQCQRWRLWTWQMVKPTKKIF